MAKKLTAYEKLKLALKKLPKTTSEAHPDAEAAK